MFEINRNNIRKVDKTEYTESQNVDYGKSSNRFLNVSPKNYIKAMQSISTKKSMIPMILIAMMDKNNKIMMTLDELAEYIEYPKTSLSVLFGVYKKNEFMLKVRNGVYMINPLVAYKGSKYERDKLIKEYNDIRNKITKNNIIEERG